MNFGRGEVAERLQCMSDLGFNGQNVVDVSICEVELRCQPLRTGREQGLYEFRFVRV